MSNFFSAPRYLSYAGGLTALAGPLHGLANQEVLGWLLGLQKTLKDQGKEITKENIAEFAWETLRGGKVRARARRVA